VIRQRNFEVWSIIQKFSLERKSGLLQINCSGETYNGTENLDVSLDEARQLFIQKIVKHPPRDFSESSIKNLEKKLKHSLCSL
jgi:hypothetical protein